MKWKNLWLIFAGMTLVFGAPIAHAQAQARSQAKQAVTCEGTLEHGSGGDYVGMKPQCWLGSVETSVSAVCKQFEHCKIVGIATGCAKNNDPHLCLEIVKLISVSNKK